MEQGGLLDGKYRIVKQLGQGGMSNVYLAENIKLGTLWAVKELKKNPDNGSDLYVEPNILKKLSHPALPRVFDIIEDNDYLYLVVDYIDGITLDNKLSAIGQLDEKNVLDWALQLCDVLSYLHGIKPNPVIYRDMKPSNIMLTDSGNVKLIDFGIAREYKSRSVYDTVFIGTMGYAAPEQYGSGQTSAASDIYSLGVTMHHLLTGLNPAAQPFEIKPVRNINPSVSSNLERIIIKCTRQNPSDRYQTADELYFELQALKNENHQNSGEARSSERQFKSFRKLLLTIWGNSEFGCELAYMAAKTSGLNVLLMDLDLLAPKADLFLNTPKCCDKYIINGKYNNSGLEVLMDAIEKSCLTSDLMYDVPVRKAEAGNLYVLTGSYQLENYEYFRDEHVVKLIDKACQSYDITIILANRSIYDSYTVISMIKSDYNIAAPRADMCEFRELNNCLAFLSEKQNIKLDKTKFTAFEYDESLNMSRTVLNEVTEGNLAGIVRHSRKRIKYRNFKASYAKYMEKPVFSDYIKLLGYFNILPKPNIIQKFVAFISDYANLPGKEKVKNALIKDPS